tara:strand:- start:7088 stop:7345 length:258 start_codon:yes stop_codon:yes gene_type:complete
MAAAMLGGMIAQSWARRIIGTALAALTVALLLFNLRRAGERSGRLTERLEATESANELQRQMLEEATRRPRSRDDLLERLRDGQF